MLTNFTTNKRNELNSLNVRKNPVRSLLLIPRASKGALGKNYPVKTAGSFTFFDKTKLQKEAQELLTDAGCSNVRTLGFVLAIKKYSFTPEEGKAEKIGVTLTITNGIFENTENIKGLVITNYSITPNNVSDFMTEFPVLPVAVIVEFQISKKNTKVVEMFYINPDGTLLDPSKPKDGGGAQ